ncbi:hypothetical protein Fmac_024947 [Flemingia macrophylla]|uniref:Protein kinase domain-containing protein n=1 Tax=Flemingia macrophylla TaxID=520843 RepID=A0ABD1LQU2_9FABA
MSPEYAMEGVFSTKSDVYSFGVLLLEIISGRKNTSFYDVGRPLNLIGHAEWANSRASSPPHSPKLFLPFFPTPPYSVIFTKSSFQTIFHPILTIIRLFKNHDPRRKGTKEILYKIKQIIAKNGINLISYKRGQTSSPWDRSKATKMQRKNYSRLCPDSKINDIIKLSIRKQCLTTPSELKTLKSQFREQKGNRRVDSKELN